MTLIEDSQESFNYFQNVFKRLQKFRELDQFCDAAIEVGGESRKCHRLVLAASCELLHSRLHPTTPKPGFVTVIKLPECFGVSVFDFLLDFLYTGRLEVPPETTCELQAIASYLRVRSLPTEFAMQEVAMETKQLPAPVVTSVPALHSSLRKKRRVRRRQTSGQLQHDFADSTSSSSPLPKEGVTTECDVVSEFSSLTQVASDAYESLRTKRLATSPSNTTATQSLEVTSCSTNENCLRCPSCSLLCRGRRALDKHIKSKHNARKFGCSFCPKSFKRKADARIHERRKHLEVKPFACQHCDKTFALNRQLTTHLRIHRDGFAFKCGDCGKAFTTEAGYRRHCSHAHKGKKDGTQTTSRPPRLFQCGQCERKFTWPHLLRRHMEAVHMKLRPHKCPQCDLSFHREEQLQQHSASHSGKREYRCDDCGKCFRQRAGLYVHKKTHSDVGKVVCDVCGYHCHTYSVLRVHQLTHSTARPFACEKCDKTFKARQHLLRHISTHERPKKKTHRSQQDEPAPAPPVPGDQTTAHPSQGDVSNDESNPTYVILSSANLNHTNDGTDDSLSMYLNNDDQMLAGFPCTSTGFSTTTEQSSVHFLSSVVFTQPEEASGHHQ